MTIDRSMPLISIITINYKQIEVTLEFLHSTKALIYPNYEIILVDNGSDIDQSSLVHEQFPDVNYYRSQENLGFAGANNLGMRKASGDYFFIVNNDTEVTPDLLNNLLKPFEYKETGAVSPKIKYFEDPTLIQYAGFLEVNKLTGRSKMLGDLEIDQGQHDIQRITAYAHGAAMLVKREVVKEIGYLHEGYFMYYEEIDWCLKMVRNGYKIYYESSAVIYHKDSVSIGRGSPMKTYYYSRNRILFMRRSYKKSQVVFFYIYFILFVLPTSLIRLLFNKQASHIPLFLKGIFWNLRNPSLK